LIEFVPSLPIDLYGTLRNLNALSIEIGQSCSWSCGRSNLNWLSIENQI